MLLWSSAFFFLFLGFWFFGLDFPLGSFFRSSFGYQRQNLQRIVSLLLEFEETLMAGLVPSAERWACLSALEEPWRTLSVDSLKELRDCGGALLPTLKRLRELAEAHRVALEEARARASQGFAQALACSLLVPLLGGTFSSSCLGSKGIVVIGSWPVGSLCC